MLDRKSIIIVLSLTMAALLVGARTAIITIQTLDRARVEQEQLHAEYLADLAEGQQQ